MKLSRRGPLCAIAFAALALPLSRSLAAEPIPSEPPLAKGGAKGDAKSGKASWWWYPLDERLLILLASLKHTQWEKITGEAGLNARDVSPELRPVLLELLPDPFLACSAKVKNGGYYFLGKEHTYTQEERERIGLRLQWELEITIPIKGRTDAGYLFGTGSAIFQPDSNKLLWVNQGHNEKTDPGEKSRGMPFEEKSALAKRVGTKPLRYLNFAEVDPFIPPELLKQRLTACWRGHGVAPIKVKLEELPPDQQKVIQTKVAAWNTTNPESAIDASELTLELMMRVSYVLPDGSPCPTIYAYHGMHAPPLSFP
jgi:hypothetical protein